MTDAIAAACANCGAPLTGAFCARCGQEAKPLDPPTRHFVMDFAQEFFDVDSRVLRSARRLVTSPGFLTREYVEGRRISWLSPLKLYLTASVAAFAMVALAGSDAGLHIRFTTSGAAPSSGARVLGFGSYEELGAAISAAREVWVPRVMFVLVPLFGWLVGRVRRDAGRHYPAHLVFALHVHAAVFAMGAITTGIGLVAGRSVAPWLGLTAQVYSLWYAFRAMRVVYGGSRLRTLWNLAAVGVIYWGVLLVVAGVVVLTAATGVDWLVIFRARVAG
jgi:hypothetical protein